MTLCEHCDARLVPTDTRCPSCGEETLASRKTPDPMLGRLVDDKYEMLDLIGEGAMGRVYSAHHRTLDRRVAIKVLHAHLANDPKVKRRFHREARATSRLSHPNSVQILDFGEASDGTLYIAMELLDGDDLLGVIEEDFPLTPERIGRLLGQVLTVLDEAHTVGIIHRDLKPENVVVVRGREGEEVVKVCDFGIAKLQEAEGGTAITMTGFVCGTPEYMAPEQARGEAIDRRADIYAAGCMLYQLLTATVPFKADTALGIITKHLTEPPQAPTARRPDLHIPASLEAVCLRAMDKNRDARFADAPAMRRALLRAIDDLGARRYARLGTGGSLPVQARSRGSTAPRAGGGRRRRWALAALAILAAAAGTAVGVRALLREPLAETTSATSATEAGAPRTGRTAGRSVLVPRTASPPRRAERMVATAPTGESFTQQAIPGIADQHDAVADVHAVEAIGATREVEHTPAVAAPHIEIAGGENDAPAAAVEHDGTASREGVRRRGRSARARRDGPGEAPPEAASASTPPTASVPSQDAPTADVIDAPPARPAGFDVYEEGRRLFLSNDVQGAITRFEEAALLLPSNPQIQKQLGRAYMREGDVERGTTAYRRYLELAPNAGDRAIIEAMLERQGH